MISRNLKYFFSIQATSNVFDNDMILGEGSDVTKLRKFAPLFLSNNYFCKPFIGRKSKFSIRPLNFVDLKCLSACEVGIIFYVEKRGTLSAQGCTASVGYWIAVFV